MRNVNPNQPFRADFLFDCLPKLLSRELSCGQFEFDQHTAWWNKNWQYISPQKSQADFNAVAREEVIQHVGPDRLKVESPKIVRDQPIESWSPCKHYGGTRLCENCKRASHVAGAMMKAEMLYRENEKFVPWFVKVVLSRRGQELPKQVVDDISLSVWHYVAKIIDSYRDLGNGPQRRTWLKQAVEWTVAQYFRDSTRNKRDSRQEVSFEALADAS